MNLLHLKYAVEVAGTLSITKAAENLYMGQPNLSRAIKELEENLGIKIFDRTSKGIVPTPQGEEFLSYARKILSQVSEVEQMYHGEKTVKQRFSLVAPRSGYISCAFTDFCIGLDENKSSEIFYCETNPSGVISNVRDNDYNLGILRYDANYDRYYKEMLEERQIRYELICEFSYRLLVSQSSPLAKKEKINFSDLVPYTEIIHADPSVPSLPSADDKGHGNPSVIDKHIYLFDRASQMDILSRDSTAFMWVSPMPARLLSLYGLVQKKIDFEKKIYKDVLICKKNYRFSDFDRKFIDELTKYKREIYNK